MRAKSELALFWIGNIRSLLESDCVSDSGRPVSHAIRERALMGDNISMGGIAIQTHDKSSPVCTPKTCCDVGFRIVLDYDVLYISSL